MKTSRSLLFLSMTFLFGTSSYASDKSYDFAIPNALRPSAKQPVCSADGETKDGCVFHSRQGNVNRVRLPVTANTKWLLESQKPVIFTAKYQSNENNSEKSVFEVIDVTPNKPEDADITLVFNKIETVKGGKPKLIERRKINIMKHSEKTWNE